MTTPIPVIMTSAGAVPTPPLTIYNTLINTVSAQTPDYTVLPGGLIDDISGTDVAAIVLIDQAQVETINSMTPYGANEFILNQLGNIYGTQRGTSVNASVNVVFSGSVGYIIQPGFLVSDGVNTYSVVDGGAIQSGGTVTLYCLAQNSGITTGAAANTITSIATSVQAGYTVTCNNPQAGLPQLAAETEAQYRAHVLNSGLVMGIGFVNMLETKLISLNVPANLIVVQQGSGTLWKIIIGAGDIYQNAYAIYIAMGPMISLLTGSATTPRNNSVTIIDGSDTLASGKGTYTVLYVSAVQQAVAISLTWNAIGTNLISASAIQQLAAQPLADYINGIVIGQPINVFSMQTIFTDAVRGVIPPNLLDRMVFVVSIDGTPTSPTSGTGAIYGDPEGYFLTNTSLISITQG